LVLKNENYLPVEAVGLGGEPQATMELRTTVALDAGEFIEIVAAAIGEAGEVRLEETGATLSLTLIDEAEIPPAQAVGEP
jgi:hypothetical protein